MNEQIRKLIKLFGADICGFVYIDRLDNPPDFDGSPK
jgi:hypothetical protein